MQDKGIVSYVQSSLRWFVALGLPLALFLYASGSPAVSAPASGASLIREVEPNGAPKIANHLGRAVFGPSASAHYSLLDVDYFEVDLSDPGVSAPWNVDLTVSGWTEAPTRIVLMQPYDGSGSAVVMCGVVWVDGPFTLTNFKALYRDPIFTRLYVRVDRGDGDYVVQVQQE